MHQSGSLLLTCLERIRIHLDEASVDPKFSDNDIIRHFISPAYAEVWSRINLNTEQPLVMRVPLALVSGTEKYLLPWGVGEIWRICAVDDQGRIMWDAKPRGKAHPSGPSWSIEGNMIDIRPFPQADDSTVQLWYLPSGEFQMHYSPTTGFAYDSGTKVITLDTSPTYGMFDRRPGAYAGQMIRTLPSSGIWQERYISEYTDNTTTNKNVKTFLDFNPEPGATGNAYEISAPGFESLTEAIALRAALKMSTGRKIPESQSKALEREYKGALKTIFDQTANIQTRTGKSWERMTVDRLWSGLTKMQ